MGKITDQIKIVGNHLREHGMKEAYNYAVFRYLFSQHSPLVSHIINTMALWPPYIEVEVTTRCNLKCVMCERTYWHEPSLDMSYDQFVSIVRQFPRLSWIGLTGIGESFLNKDFMRIVQYVKDRKIIVELFDTFYFWDKERSRQLITMGVNRVLPSFDAATAATYNKIRVNSDFERVVKNIRDFFAVKRELGKKLPEVCFHFIVSRDNIHEMLIYIDLVRDIVRDDEVSIQYTEVLHGFPEIRDRLVTIPDELIQQAEARGRQQRIKILWNRNVCADRPNFSQCTLWTMPFIFVTGHVIPCCGGNEANRREYQKQHSMGNVFEQDFRLIWHGEQYTALRRMLLQNRIPAACVGCPSFGKKAAPAQR